MASRFPVPFGGRSSAGRGDSFLSLHREMNRLFDDVFRSMGDDDRQGAFTAPQLDVHESDEEVCISADLPGVAESDIDLRLEGDMLIIRGEKKRERERDERGYRLVERSAGTFQRAIRLPFEPDPAKVTADCRDGVLTVHVPKQGQQERSRRIQIGRGSAPVPERTIEAQTGAANDRSSGERQQAASQEGARQAGGAQDNTSGQRTSGQTGSGQPGG